MTVVAHFTKMAIRRSKTTPVHREKGGFTIIEIVIAMTVMLIGLLAFTSTSLIVHSVSEADRERRLAVSGLRIATQRLQARSTAAIESDDGWAVTLTQAYLAGVNPGPTFDVEGLDPWDGLPNVGSIQVITDETTTDADIDVNLGMPRDLDMDGLAVSNDVSNSAEILPVVIRMRWSGGGGDRELVQGFWVSRM